jgi:phosphoribosylanthranilate isomerase
MAGELELDVVQLHGSEGPEFCRRVRESGPWTVWKAIQPYGDRLLEAVERYRDHVDAVLLEGASARGRGGVGARFDWEGSAGARAGWPPDLRLVLAGGLKPSNVEAAIGALAPHVVDVCSGVEIEVGRKDPRRLRAFVGAVRETGQR